MSNEFNDFYNKNFNKVFNYILRRVVDYEHSLDIVQETFFALSKNFEKFSSVNENAKSTYLYKSINSKIVDYFRANKDKTIKLEEYFEKEDENFDMTSEFQIEEEVEETIKAIQKLNKKYQEVIFLKYVEELDYSEIAEIMDKKESTLRSLVKRGLEKLKKYYEDS